MLAIYDIFRASMTTTGKGVNGAVTASGYPFIKGGVNLVLILCTGQQDDDGPSPVDNHDVAPGAKTFSKERDFFALF